MDTSKQKSVYLTQLLVIIASALMLIGIFTTRAYAANPAIFDLRFNIFALISATSAIVNLAFLWYVSRTSIKGVEAVWFYIFISCIFLYSVFETFQRLSANPEGAMFWARLLGIVVVETGAAYIFTLNYLGSMVKHIKITAIVLLSAIILFFFHANGNVIFQNDLSGIESYPWGFNNDIGPGFIFHFLWLISVATATITLFYNFIRSTKNVLLRKQAQLFLWAFLFPLIGGVTTEVIVPLFSNGQPVVVPLHAAFGTFSAGMMLWGLKRYHAFKVSPALISGEILSLMSEAVVVINKDLKIEYFNKETEDKLVKDPKQLYGFSITDFFDQASRLALTKGINELKHKDKISLEHIVIETGGSENIYARLAVSPIPEDRGVDGYIVVITDVTELKKSYESLEAEKASVDQEVATRTKELQEARNRLLETDKLKTEFVLLTSHNLRTPLTIVKGALGLLKTPGLKDDVKKHFLADAEVSATKLSELIEDLLTISNFEAGGSLALEKRNISEIIMPLLTEMRMFAANNNNKFASHVDVGNYEILANIKRLQAGIRNVLDNAAKFTRDGSIVFTAQIDKENLVITVKDTGIGIPQKEIPLLFNKFHRATDTLQYDYEGEGIGLYLAKLIIEDHYGTIKIESPEKQGTIVTITLPLADTVAST